jgi:Protein of unknown function (DUF5661)
MSKIKDKDLKIGTKVEMEHTDNPHVAKKIALDHFAEDINYYKYLKIMESKEFSDFISLVHKVMSEDDDMEKGEILRHAKALGLSLAIAHGAHQMAQQDKESSTSAKAPVEQSKTVSAPKKTYDYPRYKLPAKATAPTEEQQRKPNISGKKQFDERIPVKTKEKDED